MTGKYDPEVIEKIRNLSIADMTGQKNWGRRIDGPCPFCGGGHKTPCFSLYPDNSFYCFSCRATGKNFIDYLTLQGYKFQDIYEEFK